EHGSLMTYLNREQSFRVLPRDKGVIYVDGDFYELMIPVGTRFDKDQYHVGKILTVCSRLEALWDEKGIKCKSDGTDWDPDSIFGFISQGVAGKGQLAGELSGADIAVCDDMGTEIADFVVARKDRIIFIHAKGVGRSAEAAAAYSAGKLT